MDAQSTLQINGETLTPDVLGALYWARVKTLIVSDLHFEKGSSFAARDIMLPPYDTRTTLMRLSKLMERYCPAQVISLGDAFHDGEAETRMGEDDAAALERLVGKTEWIWILGNHDPEPPARFAGPTHEELQVGSLVFRHEPTAGPAPGEIAGHLHPCARVASEGCVLRRRCFAAGEDRLVMPAMGAYTGGLNVLDEAFGQHFSSIIAWVLGGEGVYPIGMENLVPDPAMTARAAPA